MLMEKSRYQSMLASFEPHTLRDIDLQFAQFIQSLSTATDGLNILGFLLSHELGKGNVCLDLEQHYPNISSEDLQHLIENAVNSDVVQRITDDGLEANRPLILHGTRLYLQRYWLYETQLKNNIQQRLVPLDWPLEAQIPLLKKMFNVQGQSPKLDWQAIASMMAAQHKFSVISGGPGTGKTRTVIRLLALLTHLHLDNHQRLPIIKLAAPTGKAAMRLTESINAAKQELQVTDSIKDSIPATASTLHRLLKRNRRGEFFYHKQNPLHVDVLIVDEASMIDMPMMAKLMDALPSHGQIILLGDKDQLASVEAGSVLADICDNEHQHGYAQQVIDWVKISLGMDIPIEFLEPQGAPIRHHICQLKHSYRFNEHSGIGCLAKAANAGNYQEFQHVLSQPFKDVALLELSEANYRAFIDLAAKEYQRYLTAICLAGVDDALAKTVHELFNHFQILCAVREGDLGVTSLNLAIEKKLKAMALIHQGQVSEGSKDSQYYVGRPVMVMENDYGLNLYNGDIGIILPKQDDDGQLRNKVAFINAQQQIRWIQPSRLPKHETVFAMTVHKSQGSEFAHCALVVPDYVVPVLSKELIYTGITRAKQTLTLLAVNSVLKVALSRKVQRASGLRERLWALPAASQATLEIQTQTHTMDPEQNISGPDSQFSLF